MENISTRKKRILFISLAILILALAVLLAMYGLTKTAKAYEFSLNERDIAIAIDDTVQLKVVPDDEKDQNKKVNVSWMSDLPSVATVGEDGTVVGVSGGETRVTAVIKFGGKKYSASCVVTVKSSELEYSTYKVRWFTQKQDRSGYDVSEESYERLIGSAAELTAKDASKDLPANYSFNKDKSVLTGTVQQQNGACVLEVYYDVAEITYSVDYCYESDKKLGIYDSKETKKYKAYAFSEVQVTDAPKTGFVINEQAKGTVAKNTSVVAGSKLKVYCDRIRSQVTITYVSGKKTATYENVYGVGLQKASSSALTDSLSPYNVACYIKGEMIAKPNEYVKTITTDTTMEFKVKAVGFEYSTKEKALVNVCEKSNTSSYTYLQGSGNTIYLSATYNTTGSKSNMFGITIRSGGTSREIRFQYQGVGVMKDHTSEGGTLSKVNPVYAYNTAGAGGNTYVWAQNTNGSNGMVKDSVVNKMLKYRWDASHDIIWAVWEGVLYCSVDGETAIRLPLNLLNKSWTADTNFEIGFSTFDGLSSDDELKIGDVTVAFNEKAEEKLVTDGEIKYDQKKQMDYEPITGSYMSASSAGAAYLYSKPSKENTGISAEIEWVNKDNTNSAAGVTIQVGEESVQYIIEGMNTQLRHQTDHAWKQAEIKWVTAQVKKLVVPFGEDGTVDVQAYVKDGYFYITYNGVQAHCINLLSLFPEYKENTEVSIGLYTWDANNGLARFKNTQVLSKKEVNAIDSKKWGYYSEALTIDANDFTKGTLEKNSSGNKNVALLGESKAWHIKGEMDRSESIGNGGLLMGFKITSGDKAIRVLGTWNGFAFDIGNGLVYTPYNEGRTVYSFNDKIDGFFGGSKEKLPFEAVIYKDVLYVWYDEEICWKVPLTDVTFGGFEKGSEYNLSLHMEAPEIKASMTIDNVMMGYQVTEENALIETIALINANLDKWDSFTNKRLTGVLADEVETITRDGGKVVAYLNDSSDSIYLSSIYNTIPSTSSGHVGTTFNFGISIKQGDTSRQVTFGKDGTNGVLKLFKNEAWGAGPTIIRDASIRTDLVTNMIYDSDGGAFKIEWAIAEGVLYGQINGTPFAKLALSYLNETWTSDNTEGYHIGFFQWNTSAAGDVKLTDVDVLYGEEATKTLFIGENDKRVTDATLTNMYYEVFKGTYVPYKLNEATYLYGAAAKDPRAISATIQLEDKNNTASYSGITVKDVANGKTAQIMANVESVVIQTKHDGTSSFDISSMLQNDATAYTNGKCKVTAVVKNGKLYIFYNDVQAGAVALKDILPGYTNANSIQLGFSTWNTSEGMVAFKNVKMMNSEEVTTIETSDKNLWKFAFLTSSFAGENVNVNYAEGSITNPASNSSANVVFLGQDEVWEVSGTMHCKATSASSNLMMGFKVISGDKTLEILGQWRGFARVINGNWSASNIYSYNGGANTYAFNPEKTNPFFGANTNDRSVEFKAVIYDDILYAWFDGELSWRVPLTSAEFGSFATNSKYQFALDITSGVPQGSFTDVKVKTGTDVTVQEHFISDATNNKQYSFNEAMMNITRWNWGTLWKKRLVGPVANVVKSYANEALLTTGVYAYLKDASNTIYLSVNANKLKEDAFNFGITLLETGVASRQIYLRTENNQPAVGVMHSYQYNAPNPVVTPSSEYWVGGTETATLVKDMLAADKDTSHKFVWVVADGYLKAYIGSNQKQFLNIPLNKIYSGWNANTSLVIGVAQNNPNAAGDVMFTNIDVFYNDAAKTKIQQITK